MSGRLRERTIVLLVIALLFRPARQALSDLSLVHGLAAASFLFKAGHDVLLKEVVEEAICAHDHDIFVPHLVEVDVRVVR